MIKVEMMRLRSPNCIMYFRLIKRQMLAPDYSSKILKESLDLSKIIIVENCTAQKYPAENFILSFEIVVRIWAKKFRKKKSFRV